MLEVRGLNVFYGESQVLWNVDLHVPPGQVVCLMGRNGVGKTTLLKSIMGLLRGRSGSIVFAGEGLSGLSSDRRAQRGIGYVPQGREIFPNLTVLENLRVGLVAQGRSRGSIPEEVFALFPVLRGILNRKGGVLSGGEQQQLAIARALVTRPKLLLLDEPTEGIQPSIILEVEEVIRRIRAEGRISVLLVEQYVEFARRLADSYALMEKGAIVSDGTMRELKEDAVRRHLTL